MGTMFKLFRTPGGRFLITTEDKLRSEDLDMVTRVFDAWAKGPQGSVVVVSDCTYEGEIVDGAVRIIKANIGFGTIDDDRGPLVADERGGTSPAAGQNETVADRSAAPQQ